MMEGSKLSADCKLRVRIRLEFFYEFKSEASANTLFLRLYLCMYMRKCVTNLYTRAMVDLLYLQAITTIFLCIYLCMYTCKCVTTCILGRWWTSYMYKH